ncbi:hypothetical protein LCGC14_2413750 [marine sediment metagenome]|uniref:dUTP diphosphatase n=1 Tax=marine sediment metagenome TaxID=412755 RepID=A0A0F9BRR5_9ZZZZ
MESIIQYIEQLRQQLNHMDSEVTMKERIVEIKTEERSIQLTMTVKKLHPDAQLPIKAHDSDLGWDLCAVEDTTVPSWNRRLVRTGIAVQFPKNVGGILKDRSGVASKQGLFVKAGVIDPNYRGEIYVLLWNSTRESIVISPGARICQLILMPSFRLTEEIGWVDELDDTDRGEGGFGSSES